MKNSDPMDDIAPGLCWEAYSKQERRRKQKREIAKKQANRANCIRDEICPDCGEDLILKPNDPWYVRFFTPFKYQLVCPKHGKLHEVV